MPLHISGLMYSGVPITLSVSVIMPSDIKGSPVSASRVPFAAPKSISLHTGLFARVPPTGRSKMHSEVGLPGVGDGCGVFHSPVKVQPWFGLFCLTHAVALACASWLP